MAIAHNDSPVWFITGCSSGLGRALADEVLRRGFRCVATTRDGASLRELASSFRETALVLPLNVADREQREQAVASAEAAFGRIDVLVNNAGYGYLAAIEEGEDEEIRSIFEINVFAVAALIRRVLPAMRERGSGHIINMSSLGGVMGNPSSGYYSATKFAVEGLSEALSKEVRPLGVKVTLIEPGPFRTDFYGHSIHVVKSPIDAYAATAAVRRAKLAASHGQQAGDPVRAAHAIIRVAEMQDPPLRLALGKEAVYRLRKKLTNFLLTLDQWEAVSAAADFPESSIPASQARQTHGWPQSKV
jgi:NAD(P)-dependent dehydrogenase (short-subunit alcohol dehydrogenase family)